MKTEICVSIIVPVYNIKEDYLKQCVISLINQTLKDIEIILVDDGSDEQCRNQCDVLSNLDDRIIVIHQNNSGVSSARNNGIKFARGKYVVFVDADDWVLKNYCAQLYSFAMKNSLQVVLTNAKICYPTHSVYTKFEHSHIMEESEIDEILFSMCGKKTKHENIVGLDAPWAVMILRDFLIKEAIEFPLGLKRSQDLIFNINLYSKASKVGYVEDFEYNYRMSNSSVCRSFMPDINEQAKQLISEYVLSVKSSGKYNQIKNWYSVKMVIFLLTDCFNMNYLHPKNYASFNERRIRFKKLIRSKEVCEILKDLCIDNLQMKYRIPAFFAKYRSEDMCFICIAIYKYIKEILGRNVINYK